MKMNLGFTVIANCSVAIDEIGQINHEKKEIELSFDIESAQKFIMRIGPDIFDLNDKIKIRFLRKDDVISTLLLIVKDDCSYIVTNHEQLLRDVHEGYLKIQALDKISTILDFDFEAGLEFQE